MTPLLQLRVWLRRGPNGERIAAGLASVMFLALLVWVLVPVEDEESSVDVATAATETTSGTVEGEQDTTVEPGGEEAAGAVQGTGDDVSPERGASAGTTGSTTGSVEGSESDRCAGLRATDQGVSPTEVLVAAPIVNLVGDFGNETFGVRTADEIGAVVRAVVDGINGQGGVACRKLRVKTYRVNPLNPEEQRARCLEIIGDKPFAVIDNGGYLQPVSRACFREAGLPFTGPVAVNEEEALGAFPLMYSAQASTDRQPRNWVFEAAARGWFDPQNGFRGIGLLLDECNAKANAELVNNLAKLGVPRDQQSPFTMRGCSMPGSQSQISQALVQHRNADVSHVFLAGNNANAQNYVRQADGIRWTPAYTAADYGNITQVTTERNWPDGFDGALAITSMRSGERNSGVTAPWVARCNEWMKKAGVPPSETEQDGAPMSACDMFRLFAAAANAVGPNLVRTALVADGLPKVGRFETAVFGDTTYDRPRKIFGGDFIRAIRWQLDCKCWKVVDRDTKPGH